MEKIYYESLNEAIERNKPLISSTKKRLEDVGVKYVLSSWIDMHGIPKTKPVPTPRKKIISIVNNVFLKLFTLFSFFINSNLILISLNNIF